MTLIVTTVSHLGILQISDSNLTYERGELAGTGPKVFSLGFCPGALALAGSYSLNGVGMDTWMPSVIDEYESLTSQSLEGFARHLAERLTDEIGPQASLLAHVAGYARGESGSHPEMWFIRNVSGIDESTGAYTGRSDKFSVTEDFWDRDYRDDSSTGRTRGEGYLRWYFNGLPQGRISFNVLNEAYWGFLRSVWSQPTWTLHPPTELTHLKQLMCHELEAVGTLFAISGLHHVGGEIQVEMIYPPADAVPL